MELDVAILGAGAAGMMAAVAVGEAGRGLKVGVFEKNVRPGIKVLVCGGGRCNFTNAGSVGFLIEQFGRNGRFLTPALLHMDNDALREWFAREGVPSHEEHDGKIYPDSNQAKSVVDALLRRMREQGAEVLTGSAGTVVRVEKIGEEIKTTENTEGTEDGREGYNSSSASVPSVSSVVHSGSSFGFRITTGDGAEHGARVVVIAVGGMSYQKMGTTGDGYRFAELLGHKVVTPRPAIVGLLVAEEWVKELQGVAVKGVEVRIVVSGPLPVLATGRPVPSVNDILFTHFGLSGPAVLNPSEIVAELLEKFPTVTVRVDFCLALSHEEVGGALRGLQQKEGKRLVRKALAESAELGLPTRLAEKFCELEGISAEQACATLNAGQMHRLVERIKNSRFTVTGTRGFKEAMVTAGGVKLSEVDPKTMESKVVKNLFLTGEVLDLTGPSGGYNLQLAFSTGHLAGGVIGERLGTNSGDA